MSVRYDSIVIRYTEDFGGHRELEIPLAADDPRLPVILGWWREYRDAKLAAEEPQVNLG